MKGQFAGVEANTTRRLHQRKTQLPKSNLRSNVCRALLTIGLIGLVGIISPKALWAHGGGTPQLAGDAAGPYRVYAWTSPEPWREGDVHIDVAVAEPAQGADAQPGAEIPVTDAEVHLQVTHVESGTTIEMPADPLVFLNSFYYEADFELPESGVWQVEIHVSTAEGAGSTGFEIEALPPREIDWLFLGGGLGALVATAALWAYWSSSGQPAAPQPPRRGSRRMVAHSQDGDSQLASRTTTQESQE